MELHKKIKGNALSAYFMIGASILFLWNKGPYMDHPFVKNHVKTAFSLHMLLFAMLFLMGYDVGSGISLFWIASLNDVITSALGLLICSGIFYGAYKAHMGETITLLEIFHTTWANKDLFQVQKIEDHHEEQNTFLILAHIPFFGFIISGQHPTLPHMREISQFHMISMLLVIFLYITGFHSAANMLFLIYIVWSVIQALRLTFQQELTILGVWKLPTAGEKYILQQSFFQYLSSTLHSKKDFIPFASLVSKNTQELQEQKKADTEKLSQLPEMKIPDFLLYIPWINLIGLASLKTRKRIHIENGIILTVLFFVTLILFSWKTPVVLLFLFPLFCGIGKLRDVSYRMPYIHDIWEIGSLIAYRLTHLFSQTRELQKKQVKESLKIEGAENKKEA